jgi:hypothetical protein
MLLPPRILIYSKTEVVPEWANELSYLQYLYVARVWFS